MWITKCDLHTVIEENTIKIVDISVYSVNEKNIMERVAGMRVHRRVRAVPAVRMSVEGVI